MRPEEKVALRTIAECGNLNRLYFRVGYFQGAWDHHQSDVVKLNEATEGLIQLFPADERAWIEERLHGELKLDFVHKVVMAIVQNLPRQHGS